MFIANKICDVLKHQVSGFSVKIVKHLRIVFINLILSAKFSTDSEFFESQILLKKTRLLSTVPIIERLSRRK